MILFMNLLWAEPMPDDDSEKNTTTSSEDTAEEVSALIKMPELLEYVQAPYPIQAKKEGREGIVLLLIEIDEVGEISYVEILRSAGKDFDDAAVAAAWEFLFTPAEDENGPTPVQIEFEYGFVLDASQIEGAIEDNTSKEDIPPAPINVEIILHEMGTKILLPEYESILEATDGTTLTGISDKEGKISFRGIPTGTTIIRFSHPDYQSESRSFEVTEGEVTTVDLWVKNKNYREDELVGVYRKPTADITKRTLSMEEIRRVPGTFGDPVRVIQSLPGAARSPFGTGALVIRGANPEDSAVYVDGIRIPLIYHIGGYVSVLNADLISSVDYLPGSYSVKYGRSLGGVVDVKTKQAYEESSKMSWNSDLLDSGGFYQGKVGDWGVAVAARRSYIDTIIPYFTRNSNFVVKPRWYDYQLKIDRLKTDKDKLSFFIFGFDDKLLTSTPDNFAQGTDQDAQGDIYTQYSTHRIYALWRHQFSDTSSIQFTPSYGIDVINLDIGGGLRVNQYQPTAEVRLEHFWIPNDHISLTSGLDFIGGGYEFTIDLPFSFENAANFDPLAERDPVQLKGSGFGWGPDVYVNAQVNPLKNIDRWRLDIGFRNSFARLTEDGNSQVLLSSFGFDPRFASRLQVTESTVFKNAIGIYTQPPQPFEMWRPEGSTELGFERATSAEVGIEQQLPFDSRLDVSLFGKKLDRLVVQNTTAADATDLFYTNEGIGRVYGLEGILRKAPTGKFFGWVSYTLSRSERNDYPTKNQDLDVDVVPGSPESGDWYIFDLDQTHILVAVAGYNFPLDFGFSGKIQYVTGNPFTPYAGGVYDIDQDTYFAFPSGNYNSERLPPFYALDLRIDKLFTFKKWQMELYTDFLNVVKGDNPEVTLYNYDYTESRYIGSLPFIPSIGIQANFNL